MNQAEEDLFKQNFLLLLNDLRRSKNNICLCGYCKSEIEQELEDELF